MILAQRLNQIAHVDSVGRKPAGDGLDAEFPLPAAVRLSLGHSFQALKPGQDHVLDEVVSTGRPARAH